MRVGYLCMQSEFSTRPLEALLERGYDVRFVMRPLPRDMRRMPTLHRQLCSSVGLGARASGPRADPFVVAERAGIPRWLVGDASSAHVSELLRVERIDVLAIAFFNQLLRAHVFESLPLGAINAHPSLLPRYRGPAPLFWTFKDGEEQGGVTVHRLGRGEDDGDVLVQLSQTLALGTSGESALQLLGEHAARGTVQALEGLASGKLQATPQDAALATRAPRPSADDLRIDPTLPARQVFSFVRGVGRWNKLSFDASGAPLRVVDALDLDENARIPVDYALQGDVLLLQCSPGVVALRTQAG